MTTLRLLAADGRTADTELREIAGATRREGAPRGV